MQATDYAREAIAVAEKSGEASVLAGGQFIIAIVEALTGRLNEAKPKVNRALNISQTAGDFMYESLSLGLLGHFKNWTGDFTEAIDLLYRAYRIAKKNQLLVPLFDNLFMYGIALTGKGEYDQAYDIFQEGLTFTEKSGQGLAPERQYRSCPQTASRCRNCISKSVGHRPKDIQSHPVVADASCHGKVIF